jgi:hypothetical protein
MQMTDKGFNTTRHVLLGALVGAPLAAAPVRRFDQIIVPTMPLENGHLAPITVRTREGRILSRVRYHNAEAFFQAIECYPRHSLAELLYDSGVVAQMALSSHLLDVGFDDRWCARHIGLRVATSLAYANMTGFNHGCGDMARLADILTPYSRWARLPPPTTGHSGIDPDDIPRLMRNLLDRTYHSTGHPRPRGWRRHRASQNEI